jgi:DNA-binding CsgD family transcriptional regulator
MTSDEAIAEIRKLLAAPVERRHMTESEYRSVCLAAIGYETAEIARILSVTPSSVKQYRSRGLMKLGDQNIYAIMRQTMASIWMIVSEAPEVEL